MSRLRVVVLLLFVAVVTGCASNVPPEISKKPVSQVSFDALQKDISRYTGKTVRYGGTLIKVSNQDQFSELEILLRPLDSSGLPDANAGSKGRFIAKIKGFIDPESLKKESRITVSGVVKGDRTQKIDQYDYHYPVILVDSWHSWGIYQEPQYMRDPFFDPFFYDRYYRRPAYPVHPRPRSVQLPSPAPR